MAKVVIDDPDFHGDRKADDIGRIRIGPELANKEVTVAVEIKDKDECEQAAADNQQ